MAYLTTDRGLPRRGGAGPLLHGQGREPLEQARAGGPARSRWLYVVASRAAGRRRLDGGGGRLLAVRFGQLLGAQTGGWTAWPTSRRVAVGPDGQHEGGPLPDAVATPRGRTSGLRGHGPVIFATVGTQLPFDRMIAGLDAWAGGGSGPQGVRPGRSGGVPASAHQAATSSPPRSAAPACSRRTRSSRTPGWARSSAPSSWASRSSSCLGSPPSASIATSISSPPPALRRHRAAARGLRRAEASPERLDGSPLRGLAGTYQPVGVGEARPPRRGARSTATTAAPCAAWDNDEAGGSRRPAKGQSVRSISPTAFSDPAEKTKREVEFYNVAKRARWCCDLRGGAPL